MKRAIESNTDWNKLRRPNWAIPRVYETNGWAGNEGHMWVVQRAKINQLLVGYEDALVSIRVRH